jgi:hypothetical protein
MLLAGKGRNNKIFGLAGLKPLLPAFSSHSSSSYYSWLLNAWNLTAGTGNCVENQLAMSC